MKEQGTIKWFSKSKNFGFITDKEGNDLFFRLENITKSLDELDKDENVIIPEPKDMVEYIKYSYKGQLRAKKIVIKQRVTSTFTCPHCNENITPKVVFEQNDKKQIIGQEFEEKKPMYTICPNCYHIIEKYETKYDSFSSYNRAATLLLILLVLGILVKIY